MHHPILGNLSTGRPLGYTAGVPPYVRRRAENQCCGGGYVSPSFLYIVDMIDVRCICIPLRLGQASKSDSGVL